MADAAPTSNLAPMFGDYVTDYLSKGQALSNTGFSPYEGNRYAGPSSLQQQAFSGIGGLTMPSYFGQAGSMYTQAANSANPLDPRDSGVLSGFMNPYIQNVIDSSKREAQRTFDMQQAGRDASAVKAGAFGGSRQALVDSEANRNLNLQMGDIQTSGMKSAYDTAMGNINTYNNTLLDSARTTGSLATGLGSLGTGQMNAQQGILNQQMGAGATQQQLNQQPLDFGYDQWQQSLQYPYQQLQFQQGLLQGLPLSVQSQPQSNALLEGLMGAGGIYNLLFGGN